MRILIYGAYGFTGRLVVREALRRGLRPILSGRRDEPLEKLARASGLEYSTCSLSQTDALARLVSDVDGVLNCAGPFSETAAPLVAACLSAGSHYLDITGETGVISSIKRLSDEALVAGVMLLPAIGVDVAPTDVVAGVLHTHMPDATHLAVAMKSTGPPSRGTMRTILRHMGSGGAIGRDGRIERVPIGWRVRTARFDRGEESVMSAPLGDIVTAFVSTGIPNIEGYIRFPRRLIRRRRIGRWMAPLARLSAVQRILERRLSKYPEGPDEETAHTARLYIWGEVKGENGVTVEAVMQCPEAYRFTAAIAVEALFRMSEGDVNPGFQTPTTAFGVGFLDRIPGVVWLDRPS